MSNYRDTHSRWGLLDFRNPGFDYTGFQSEEAVIISMLRSMAYDPMRLLQLKKGFPGIVSEILKEHTTQDLPVSE